MSRPIRIMRCWIPLCVGLALGCEEKAPQKVDCHTVQVGTPVEVIQIYFDLPDGADLHHLRRDLQRILPDLGATSVQVHMGAPTGAGPQVHFRIGRGPGVSIEGDGTRFVVEGGSRAEVVYGAYVLLEEMGVRFFHPLETFLPLRGRLPPQINLRRQPMTRLRGMQPHLLHPIEWFDALNGDELEEAKRLIDWLVATGQNHLQWPILATMDLEAFKAHATQVAAYAHERNVTVGVVVSLFSNSSLQRNFTLADDEAVWQQQLETRIDDLLEVPWDHVEVVMGEFLAHDPDHLLRLLDHLTAYVSDRVTVAVTNHVGEFENLYVDFRGEETYLYFIPGFADPRLINNVHTVFFFDLFREWGMYGHESFEGHRRFLFEQLAQRPVRYKPESAYWVTADVDVPVFLPEFIQARWIDINGLHREIEARGLPQLDGHVMFSSGHEWGYWLTDYLAAQMLWRPEGDRRVFIDHFSQVFGSCAERVGDDLDAYVDLQSTYLFDRRLVPHLSGEDLHDDLGAVAGFYTHPPRVPFEAATQAAIDFDGIREMVAKSEPLIASMRQTCRAVEPHMKPWCDEILDGMEIVALRLRHSDALYTAVTFPSRGTEKLAEAAEIRQSAERVIRRREAAYRFDLERLTGAYENPTIYAYGYLRQAHRLCYWTRQAEQARHLVEEHEPALVTALPSCLD